MVPAGKSLARAGRGRTAAALRRATSPGFVELRDGEQLHVRRRERVGIRLHLRIGQRGVGGAQVDSDDVSGFQRFLLDFDFRRGDDGGVLLGGQGGQVHLGGAPSLVAKGSARRAAWPARCR